jgi:hypothetical protein
MMTGYDIYDCFTMEHFRLLATVHTPQIISYSKGEINKYFIRHNIYDQFP